MNNPFGYAWLPTKRSSLNGLVDLPHGAVNMANNARYMIMAAGNNPATGGSININTCTAFLFWITPITFLLPITIAIMADSRVVCMSRSSLLKHSRVKVGHT